ncbi:MAG: single-stranded-DNA-specific exonuclease RecJ [Saprospiraceae bacterium]
MTKQWNELTINTKAINTLQAQCELPTVFCKMLLMRGITTPSALQQFFHPSLAKLHDPFLMKDMKSVVDRLQRAFATKEKIMLYGDYDVDGVISVAMMHHFLETRTTQLINYIPDRDTEGYGVSISGIESARAHNVKLILTMDCGTKAHEPIALANRYGIDVLVCDHHSPDEELPAAYAMLNPKQKDATYPTQDLSGGGICFKLLQAILQAERRPVSDAYPYLDYVVLSTACDLVPLTGENRILAHFGLVYLRNTSRPGLLALLRHIKLLRKKLTISDLVFKIGPLLNAAGRVGNASTAVELLLATTTNLAKAPLKTLVSYNQQRKNLDQAMHRAAQDLWEKEADFAERKSIVLFQADWHSGIVGITAARLVDTFHRPTIILTESKGVIVGSARSIEGFNLIRALAACEDLLLKYGGHAYAAGLALTADKLPAFKVRFETIVAAQLSSQQLQPRLRITSELQLSEINFDFNRILQKFAPFGPGNRRPIFWSKKLADNGHTRVVKEKHLQFGVVQDISNSMGGIGFRQAAALALVEAGDFDLAYVIREQVWKNCRTIQLDVRGIRATISAQDLPSTRSQEVRVSENPLVSP